MHTSQHSETQTAPTTNSVENQVSQDTEISLGASEVSTRPASVVQRARQDPRSLRPSEVLQLQRTIGNRAVCRMLHKDQPAGNTVQRLITGVVQRGIDNASIAPSQSRNFWQTKVGGNSQTPASTAPKTGGTGATAGSPGTGNPKIQILPGKSFDIYKAAAKNKHWADVESRLKDRGIATDEVLHTTAEYVVAMEAQNEKKAKYILNILNAQFQKHRGFTTRKGDALTKNYKDKSSLWSGAKEQALDYANTNNGIALEGSRVGSVFDGLNFGLDWGHLLIKHQWNEFSRLYADGIIGEVHIHQYRGVRGQSVFNTVEYPTIKDKIDLGLIEPVIHLYSNWGKLQSFKYGAPLYGKSGAAGDNSRKKETEKRGKSELDNFMANKWEFGDAIEKKGGYWKSGTQGKEIDTTDDKGNPTRVYEGTEW
ncbi:MAG: hypothetical protein J0I20_12825 [Chloroflexi bacterium]|nr:hypothetical protein [Chloroflexota bacterium]OJV92589.1 MAG: hypothetical protein BGO39_32335 [Chloroflexi bacterium 54-19]